MCNIETYTLHNDNYEAGKIIKEESLEHYKYLIPDDDKDINDKVQRFITSDIILVFEKSLIKFVESVIIWSNFELT